MRLSGCLPVLRPRGQQVLSWRAGLGVAHPFSQSQVATFLGLSLGQERDIEHGAVNELVSAASTDGCAGAQAAPVSALVGNFDRTLEVIADVAGPPGSGATLLAEAGPTGSGGSPTGSAGGPGRASTSGASATQAGGIPPIQAPPRGSSKQWMFEAGLALALLGILALLGPPTRRMTLRRLHHAAATETPPGGPIVPPAAIEAAEGGSTEGAAADGPNHGPGDGAAQLDQQLTDGGDGEDALAAYQALDERGSAVAALVLGGLLAKQGDVRGARAAYQRAYRRGEPSVAEAARAAELDLSERR